MKKHTSAQKKNAGRKGSAAHKDKAPKSATLRTLSSGDLLQIGQWAADAARKRLVSASITRPLPLVRGNWSPFYIQQVLDTAPVVWFAEEVSGATIPKDVVYHGFFSRTGGALHFNALQLAFQGRRSDVYIKLVYGAPVLLTNPNTSGNNTETLQVGDVAQILPLSANNKIRYTWDWPAGNDLVILRAATDPKYLNLSGGTGGGRVTPIDCPPPGSPGGDQPN